jgi:hypothetical protein
MSDKLQKSNQELSEAQKYYIDLFTKWKMWQEFCPEKLPEGYKTQGDFNFSYEIYLFEVNKVNLYNHFVNLANHDNELDSINLIMPKSDLIIDDDARLLISFENMKINKKICTNISHIYTYFYSASLIFHNVSGLLRIENVDSESNSILKLILDEEENNFDKITLSGFNISGYHEAVKEYLLKMYSQEKLELINCNFPELDNLKLQNELEIYKQNNQLSANRIKVFHFNQKLLGDYKASFAEYFMGLKDFILYAQGKNIGVDIQLNGSLELKVYSDNEQDLDAIRLSINDYVSNLLNPNNEPKIHSGVNAVDPQKALILMKSKLNSLETSLQLKDSQLITNENLIKYLKEVALDFQSKNEVLSEQNKQLASQLDETILIISTLKFHLTQIKVKDLYANDKIDTIINLLGTLTLVISQKKYKINERNNQSNV